MLRSKSSTEASLRTEHGQPTSAGSTRKPIAATKGDSYDDQPGPGTWTYRVGVSANWLDDPRLGDVYVAEPACHRDGSVTPSRNCCSSSASRWARIVFWSESREMTVE